MALPQAQALQANLQARTLEMRVAQLEKALQSTDQSLILQVGNSSIEITATGITLKTRGKIELRTSGDVRVWAGANVQVEAIGNASHKASGTMLVAASSTLSLKGSTINEN